MVRKKMVFPTSEIPHLWAHQTQDSARNGQGNLYFSGKTIYSYGSHFPIASWIENERGEKAVLLTTRTYLSTTERHISDVRSSIPNSVPVFPAYDPRNPNPTVIITNQAELVKDAEAKWRKKTPLMSSYMDRYAKDLGLHNRMVQYFGVSKPLECPLDWNEMSNLAIQKQGEHQKRKAEASLVRRARRDDSWNQIERERELYESSLKESKEDRMTKWLTGESVSTYGFDSTLLRIEGNEVVTSMGARFPRDHAKRGLVLVNAVRAKGEQWQSNGHTCRLGHYAIDKIDPDGTVYAGCHKVSYAAIESIASQL